MPHLHLPIDHTDADLVLAANLAEIVGSEDLYVAWTHEAGAGAVPEVEAEVREERQGARSARSSPPSAPASPPSGARCWAARRTLRSTGRRGRSLAPRPAERPYAD